MTFPIEFDGSAGIDNLNTNIDFFLLEDMIGPIDVNFSEKILLEFAKKIATLFEINDLTLNKGINYYL
jgi:hypothetical protein